ncbi:MAG: acylphosphatase [Bacteriovoracaceae bacterium]|nr:acylphosphatase [Bacteriovoracaceae bacterium]
MEKKAIKIKVNGRVQGVCYRHNAAKMAKKLGIVGYAKNLPDGSVELVAQGNQQGITQFINWCGQGPTMSKVDELTQEAIVVDNDFINFETY